MPNKSGRSTEHEIAFGVIRYLATVPSGTATIAEIKQHLPDFVSLTTADLEQSPTRNNERVWEQQVRNIVSHRQTEGNAINDGLLANSTGEMSLTDAGRNWLARRGA
jgi:hypothetical protein